MKLYTSDTHFHHSNIIKYCDRPFKDVRDMDATMIYELGQAEETGAEIFHLGDLAFDYQIPMKYPERHTLIVGNHDRVNRKYFSFAQRIVGTKGSWRENNLLVLDVVHGRPFSLLLSHAPQADLRGADFNIFGHCHNTYDRDPERFYSEAPWIKDCEEYYFNVSVELHDYRPVTLEELITRRKAGETLL